MRRGNPRLRLVSRVWESKDICYLVVYMYIWACKTLLGMYNDSHSVVDGVYNDPIHAVHML